MNIDCPVCPRKNIPPENSSCPQCGVDLAPLRRVRQLGGSFYQDAKHHLDQGDRDAAVRSLDLAVSLHGVAASIPAALLLAKLMIDSGKSRWAAALLEKVIVADPDNEEARELLAAEAPLTREKPGSRSALRIALAVVAILAVVAAFFIGELSYKTFSAEYKALSDQAGESASLQAQVQNLVSEADSMRNQLAGFELAEMNARRCVELLDEIYRQAGSLQNTLAQRSPDAVILVPIDGLFKPGGKKINSESTEILNRIASFVNKNGNAIILEIEGHADSVPSIWDPRYGNWILGLERASVVATYLTSVGGISRDLLNICSAGETNPPFPNDSEENMRKNRTVTFRIHANPNSTGNLTQGEG